MGQLNLQPVNLQPDLPARRAGGKLCKRIRMPGWQVVGNWRNVRFLHPGKPAYFLPCASRSSRNSRKSLSMLES